MKSVYLFLHLVTMKKSKLLFIVSLISLSSFAQPADKSVSVKFRGLIISDRNVGAPSGGIALNYTNDENHADHSNLLFKGNLYVWREAVNICPKGWRLPTRNEVKYIAGAIGSYWGALDSKLDNESTYTAASCLMMTPSSSERSRRSGRYGLSVRCVRPNI